MSRSLARAGALVADAAPGCPQCGQRLGFGSDRDGRMMQVCECGYRGYVPRRSGSATSMAVGGVGPAAPPLSGGWDRLMRSVGLRGDLVTQTPSARGRRPRTRGKQ